MTNLITRRPLLSRFFDDDTNGFPDAFLDDDRMLAPSRLFNTPFFRSAGKEMTIPAVNIKDNAKHYTLELALPGFKKEDLNVHVQDNVMTISSEKKKESEEEKKGYTRKEFSYSSFSRSFALPENVDSENVKAKFNDGVLVLTINKTKELPKSNVKKIKVD